MILQEADFLKVNLKTMSNTNSNNTSPATTGAQSTAVPTEQDNIISNMLTKKEDNATHKAWGQLLAGRLDKNSKLTGEAKLPEQAVIKEFFKEYFNAVWGATAGNLLFSFGNLLRNDIQKLGFDKTKNPLLAFIAQSYVVDELIAKKLLNAETYKALHNAIAKDLLAHSELYGKRTYNIIYCRDFYKRTPADMLKYLNLQQACLPKSESNYSLQIQCLNRRIFFLYQNNKGDTFDKMAEIQADLSDDQAPSALDPKVKLMPFAASEETAKLAGVETSSKQSLPVATSDDIAELASKLTEPDEQLALMQYLFAQTGSDEAMAFINQTKFRSVSTAKATLKVHNYIKGIRITKKAVKQLIDALQAGVQ